MWQKTWIPDDVPRYDPSAFRSRKTPLGTRFLIKRNTLGGPDRPVAQWATIDGIWRFAFFIGNELFCCQGNNSGVAHYTSTTRNAKAFVLY